MKSSVEELAGRGFLGKGVEKQYAMLSPEEKIKLLYSRTPTERTLGARLLATEKQPETVQK